MQPSASIRRPLTLVACLSLLPVLPAASAAQDPDRIWGEVMLVGGDSQEGFIRWDRNEGSWGDILNGSREIPEEAYEAWLAARRGGERPTRSIDLKGYRITWDEEDPDFPSAVTSGIRFGHLAGLEVVDRDRVALTLRSGEWLELFGGSTDIGWSMRELIVEVPGQEPLELDWGDLDRVVFSAAPPDARPRSARLWGTVEDEEGDRFTGWISWDLDEILGDDVLDGEDPDGDDREIEMRRLRRIERTRRGALVTLTSGESVELRGTNDVDSGHRGVQVSDPDLGMVEVRWRRFSSIRFTDPPQGRGYDAFDGGHRLEGTVRTTSGEELEGRVRWDADEQASWELLNGRSERATFSIEFGHIRSIARAESSGAVVTLLDGRSYHLDHSNDVDEDNKGIFVEPPGAGPDGADPADWRYVPWEDFQEVRFRHPADAAAAPEDVGAEGRGR